jgi:hypothetical protein
MFDVDTKFFDINVKKSKALFKMFKKQIMSKKKNKINKKI